MSWNGKVGNDDKSVGTRGVSSLISVQKRRHFSASPQPISQAIINDMYPRPRHLEKDLTWDFRCLLSHDLGDEETCHYQILDDKKPGKSIPRTTSVYALPPVTRHCLFEVQYSTVVLQLESSHKIVVVAHFWSIHSSIVPVNFVSVAEKEAG